MTKTKTILNYDVVVVGGGMSGLCAALASARHGAKTALIHNRPVLGGNASSEIRMHICGADNHAGRPNARETGIIEEILLENKRRNPNHSFSLFDTVLWEKASFQEGLKLYLNTHMTEAVTDDSLIQSVIAEQLTTETTFEFRAPLFIDTTGDGTLAALAGADTMSGREGKDVFGETYAPDKSDHIVMGSSLLFKAVDTGKPVPFIKPWWANTYAEEDLAFRGHEDFSSGYWWIELGGDELDTIKDGEALRDELLKAVYGVWDHIKNSGSHPTSANWDLDWVGFLPGKRESRRVTGDYILLEQDCFAGRVFDDAIAYGGWPMDMHIPGGLKARLEPTVYLRMDEVYTIPYRCLYSKNVGNLFVGGRAISVSHMAFGSTRVMATCAIVGQAAGTAAALATQKRVQPRDLLKDVHELQQTLLRDDCYIPGFKNEDRHDIAITAAADCSSESEGGDCSQIQNGVSRPVGKAFNGWISGEINDGGVWLRLTFQKFISPKEIHLKFDSNVSREIMISLSKGVQNRQVNGIPPEIVRDYSLEFYQDDRMVHSEKITDNTYRFRVHRLTEVITCNRILLRITATNGSKTARVFEVRVYE